MTEPLLSLKWLNDDVEQIEIEIRDGKEPSRIVYPKPENCEGKQCEYEPEKFFLSLINIFEDLYGEYGTLSRYGIFKGASAVLANLVCWPRNHPIMYDGNISVDKIPDVARYRLIEKIRQMVSGWKLSGYVEFDVESMATAFARFEIDNYIWLFDFEVPTEAKSLLNINKDALELEWYVFNHDDVNTQKKFSALCDGKDGVGSYMANRWMTSINENLQFWENYKARCAAKGE